MLDLDGTVYLSDKPLPRAAEAVESLRSRYKVMFLTNNTSRSKRDYIAKLERMGISAKPEDFWSAADATISYIKKNYGGKRVYLFGTDSLKEEFCSHGIELDDRSPELCVVGFHTGLVYNDLAVLCTHIRNGVPFIATHPDNNCPVSGGYIPDVGAMLALVERSTGKRPLIVCGKPNQPMADGVKSLTGLEGAQIAMIGDRIMTDMAFAADNGFCAVLVLSGEGTEQELAQAGYKAIVIDSIAELI